MQVANIVIMCILAVGLLAYLFFKQREQSKINEQRFRALAVEEEYYTRMLMRMNKEDKEKEKEKGGEN